MAETKNLYLDADSILFIVGWSLRDLHPETDVEGIDLMQGKLDSLMSFIFTLSGAEQYIGFFSDSNTFRHREYTMAEYKGSRPSKPDWFIIWGGLMKAYLLEKYHIHTLEDLEADDGVSAMTYIYGKGTIATPDKDLKQCGGRILDYRKVETLEVTETEAVYCTAIQMLMGDKSDNIVGVPNVGVKKAEKLLLGHEKLTPDDIFKIVLSAYTVYYGAEEGEHAFYNTLFTVMMLNPSHPSWMKYFRYLSYFTLVEVPNQIMPVDEALALKDIGWI